MSDEEDWLDLRPMRELIEALANSEDIHANVGILGGKTNRPKDPASAQTNADIGFKHEMGIDVPMRSFLRMPLIEKMQEYLQKSGAFDEDTLTQVCKYRSLRAFMEKVAILGELIVADAFHTGGFGKWPALSPRTMASKTTEQILVETTQLRDSITSEVVQ